jgi:hypothetical protein
MTAPTDGDPAIDEFARLADGYCALVDARAERPRADFLAAMQRQLPDLYAAALRLPDVWSPEPESPDDEAIVDNLDEDDQFDPTKPIPDPDAITHAQWKQLHGDLAELLEQHQFYSLVYSPNELDDPSPVTGDLADDFADIYRDLGRGLVKYRRGDRSEAAWEWQFHFAAHWGRHAADALRVIHQLAYELGITSAF